MSKSQILHKIKTPSVEWCIIVITTKQFSHTTRGCLLQTVYIILTVFTITLSLKSRIIFIRCVFKPLNDHHGFCFPSWLQRKNYRFCWSQLYAQNNNCLFSESWQMGWLRTSGYSESQSDTYHLPGSISLRKAHFLYCGWYYCFTHKAFVTGFASNWSSVFPSISLKKASGLWASGCFCYAFV